MSDDLKEFSWNLFTELRKELVSLQTIRSQVIGFKITFVSASVALIAANIGKVPSVLFVVPAFASIFFDLLTHSYSFSIKRTGFYCRNHLEPILRAAYHLPKEHHLWEEFMVSPEAGKNVSFWGNLGLTLLAVTLAAVALLYPFIWSVSLPLLVILAALLLYDIQALYKPTRFIAPQKQRNDYKNPKSCVAIIIAKDREILLARRGIEPAKGMWDIPGGFIDEAESAENAVVREALEETNLHVRVADYLGSFPDKYGATGVPTLNLCFVAEVISGEMKPQSDVALLSWFSLDNFPQEMAFAHQHKLLDLYRERVEGKQ